MSDSFDTHPARLTSDDLMKHVETTRVKRSGPGGQRRNKVETGVVMKHRPTGITAEASERRSQKENQKVALLRLRIKLANHVRCQCGDERSLSKLWKSRCVSGRPNVNSTHDDFPAMLAEAIDWLAAFDWNIKDAALKLECSTSQLLKFLAKDSSALNQLNKYRAELGLKPLSVSK